MHRIAFYLPSFQGGGAERNTCLIASEMVRKGHAVAVVVDRDEGPNRQILHSDVEVQVIAGGNLAHVFNLARFLRAWRVDAVFACLGVSPIVAVLAQLISQGGWKTVISYHSPYIRRTYLGVRASWWSAGLLASLSHATHGVSQDVVNQLTGQFGVPKRKSVVIHNPVDLRWVAERRLERLPDNLPQGRKFILSVGRLVDEKGYPDLINAYSLISDQISHDLVILGDGPKIDEIRRLVGDLKLLDRVHLLGYSENPFPVYAAASLFVLASHLEGFGNVIVEALACGTPVVATNCPGGPKDILAGGKFGRLVPVAQPEVLACAILDALNEPAKRDELTTRASDFAVSKISEQYLGLLDRST